MIKLGSVIHRYIFRELIPPFVISVAFLMFVFLMTTLLDITNYIVNYRVGLKTVLLLLVYNMPFFLQFVIPMSVMMAILLTFLKMSGDNEIIALKAGGMSIYALLPPVFIFCLIGCLLTAFMGIFGLPWGRLSMKSLTRRLNTASLTALLKEGTFNDSFEGRTIYVSKINPGQDTLTGIFIENQSAKNQAITITAPMGRLTADPDRQVYHLRLENGQINQADLKTKTVYATDFKTYDVRLDLKQALKSTAIGVKDEQDMSIAELRKYIRTAKKKDNRYYLIKMEFQKKFSIPFACFALGVLAVPLGIRSRSARRSFGVGLGLFFFLGYYLMLSVGFVFGEAGTYPPLIGMWVPNLVTAGIGCFLLVRCAQERPIGLGRIGSAFGRIFKRGPGSDARPAAP